MSSVADRGVETVAQDGTGGLGGEAAPVITDLSLKEIREILLPSELPLLLSFGERAVFELNSSQWFGLRASKGFDNREGGGELAMVRSLLRFHSHVFKERVAVTTNTGSNDPVEPI